jgi:hypothetical protein
VLVAPTTKTVADGELTILTGTTTLPTGTAPIAAAPLKDAAGQPHNHQPDGAALNSITVVPGTPTFVRGVVINDGSSTLVGGQAIAADGSATLDDKSALRYEGKTFDEWRTAWRTELSTQKRLEAVKALAAFGANGYGREAAEAILEVAGQYDWKNIEVNKATRALQAACVEAFGNAGSNGEVAQSIPASDSLPVLAAAVKSGSRQQKLFLTYALANISDPESVKLRLALSQEKDATIRYRSLAFLPRLSNSTDEKVVARMREALQSGELADVQAVLDRVMPFRSPPGQTKAPYPFLNELVKLFFSSDEGVRKQARRFARSLEADDAGHVADVVLKVLQDDSKTAQHIEAIRALATLGPPAKSATDSLKPFLKSDDHSISIAAAAALHRILPQSDYNKILVESLGERLGIKTTGDAFIVLPGGQQSAEFIMFENAVREEENQHLPH